ncbi:hypothetical protein I6E47_00300 [Prevotella dentalis]|jgi:hypothetical protein|nr:hypothetical protein [Prevotella dentalis]
MIATVSGRLARVLSGGLLLIMATATTPKGIALTPRLTMLGAPDMIKKMKIVASNRKL